VNGDDAVVTGREARKLIHVGLLERCHTEPEHLVAEQTLGLLADVTQG
jgi:hypothetical protein